MFSYRLKQLRENLGITQSQLAKMLNLTQSTIAYYESGKKMPTLENAILISKLFNTSLDYLVGVSSQASHCSNILLKDINKLSPDNLKDLEVFIEFLKFKDKK